MAIIKWNPWNLPSIFDEDWNLWDIRTSQGLNIYETDKELVAEAAVPGIPEDKIDVSVDNGVVRISGSMEKKEEEKEGKKFYMNSMASTFNYSFHLPENIVPEPEATLDNGVLTLVFPKAKESLPKKIAVKKKKA